MKQRTRTAKPKRVGDPSSAAPADEQLVARTLEGDRRAFETLVLRHQQPLVNHLYRLTRSRDSAFDLAQEVFIKVYTSLGTFDPRYRFTTWLYRIASNCAIDQRRKKRPWTCSLHRGPGDDGDSLPERAIPGHDPNPHDVLRVEELRARLERAIDALPPNYRQLILLRHRLHMRYDEIARTTRLPLGTVKNRIFRARELLKLELEEFLGVEARV